MSDLPTPEQTELEFDNFFKQLGYKCVSELIEKSPEFRNADYIKLSSKISVELKVIDKDFFTDGGVIHSLNAFIVKPVNINDNGTGQYTFKLPDINRKGIPDQFEEPIRRILKKANRQLRETRNQFFNNENSYGFVIIAQTGFSSLNPLFTAKIVQKILNCEFSSIDGAIICTPYYNLIDPISQRRNETCISVTKNFDYLKKTICENLADDWADFLINGGHKE
jgi:hypothetical protein